MAVQKRLYRVNENKVIMGVCTGISEYISVDVNIIRVLFVILALISGIPIILYIVMGVILPIKEIEIQKAETIDEDEYSYNSDDYNI